MGLCPAPTHMETIRHGRSDNGGRNPYGMRRSPEPLKKKAHIATLNKHKPPHNIFSHLLHRYFLMKSLLLYWYFFLSSVLLYYALFKIVIVESWFVFHHKALFFFGSLPFL